VQKTVKTVLKNLAALAGFFVIANIVTSFVFPVTFAEDARASAGIAKYVADHYEFAATSKVAPGRKPVFPSPRGRLLWFIPSPHGVTIYTVTETDAQNEILELIQNYRTERKLRPVYVTFYREENWTVRTNHDGSMVGGSRGQEEIIRTEKLK